MTGHDIEKTIEKEFSGDIEKALKALGRRGYKSKLLLIHYNYVVLNIL